jgi:adenylate kinase
MNPILLGAPGSGKGTQAKALAARLKTTHMSTGDIFRDEIAKKTALGTKVQNYVTSGKLVPDAVVTEVVTAKLSQLQGSFLLDGFPRTVEQAISLEEYLKKSGKKLDRVVYLNLSEDEVVKRLTARRNCASCNELYNMVSKPPKHAQFQSAREGKGHRRRQ